MKNGYWWECEECGRQFDFGTACGAPGIAHYIQDCLKKSWDQSLLAKDCPECRTHSLRIAYEFPKKEKQMFRVFNIVGLDRNNGAYVPMMWVTKEAPYDGNMIYDFKYVSGRKTYGLNRPAVFSQRDLKRIFDLYCLKTGARTFP